MLKWLLNLLATSAVVIPVLIFGPVVWFVSPLTFWFVGPFSCGFYCLLSCHWLTIRRAQREGRLENWREVEGGMVCTVTKSFVYMVLGIILSFGFETLVLVFHLLPILLVAAYLPLILLWLNRWRKHGTEA
jgi:hypothetical protein